MKVLVAVSTLVAIILAEPPPSNSYLPPSAAGQGYPQGPQGAQGPQIVAARNLDQGRGAHSALGQGSHSARAGPHSGPHGAGGAVNAFGRSGPSGHGPSGHGHSGHGASGHGAQARQFGDNPDHSEQGYDHNASPFGRNALGESSEPANYNFGYMVNDYQEGTDFGHHEERQDARAQGEYHVVLPDGRKQTVSYEADERGFKPRISYEESDDSLARSSGYDSNANNFRNADNFGKDAGHHGNGFQNGGNKHGGSVNARSNGY